VRIAQIIIYKCEGEALRSYKEKGAAKYSHSIGAKRSMFFEDDDSLDYPKSFVFGGCSGDWDHDGCPELVVFDLGIFNPSILVRKDGKFISSPERMPNLSEKFGFRSLSGTKFNGIDGEIHLAIGSCGNETNFPHDLVLINDCAGFFSLDRIKFLPKRRGGDDWACVKILNIRFQGDSEDLILALYHNAKVQHGLIDIYRQRKDGEYEYYYPDRAFLEENDSWFCNIEVAKIYAESTQPDLIVVLKNRGLQKFTPKEFNFVLLAKINNKFVDISSELIFLKGKEFTGISKRYNKETKLHDLIFFDNHGNHYYCLTKK
jgi:hypothetical protein